MFIVHAMVIQFSENIIFLSIKGVSGHFDKMGMDILDERSNVYVKKFHPIHQRLLDSLLSHNVGFFNRKYKIRKVERCGQSFLLPCRKQMYYDMFMLSVPICEDESLEWQIILNEFRPEARPDIKVFNNGFNLFLLDNIMRTGLAQYDSDNETELLNLVEKLKHLYYEYLASSLNKSSLSYKNISSVLDSLPRGSGPLLPHEIVLCHDLVHFCMHLDVDLSRIQLNLVPEKCVITLTLTMPYTHEKSDLDYQCRVLMGPELRDQLEANFINYPKFGQDKPMLKYIRHITSRVQSHIDILATAQRLRQRFLLSLLSTSGVSVLDWDAFGFRSASFLYSSGAFHWMVRLALGSTEVTARLVSIYTPFSCPLTSVPLESDARGLLVKLANAERHRHQCVRGFLSEIVTNEREVG
ncbi:hypothetical protein M8J75_015086 [Diaphorina citri]|nr:hypothetical protein M8J75_015086 [Diaphorina citri]